MATNQAHGAMYASSQVSRLSSRLPCSGRNLLTKSRLASHRPHHHLTQKPRPSGHTTKVRRPLALGGTLLTESSRAASRASSGGPGGPGLCARPVKQLGTPRPCALGHGNAVPAAVVRCQCRSILQHTGAPGNHAKCGCRRALGRHYGRQRDHDGPCYCACRPCWAAHPPHLVGSGHGCHGCPPRTWPGQSTQRPLQLCHCVLHRESLGRK